MTEHKQYETLNDLVAAIKSGELQPIETDGEFMTLDNDQVTFYIGDEKIFDSDPETILREALDMLGVPWEEA
jgi:hypothetical protein